VTSALSKNHQRIRRLRRLSGRRSARDAERVFVLEGAKVLSEALLAGASVEAVFAAPGADVPVLQEAGDAGIRIFDLGPGVMESVADTTTPQDVIAIAPYVDVGIEAARTADLVVVLVDVRDPGNAGTVLRTAEAAGAGAVVCCDGSVDVYNPKTVRASAGAVFQVPVVAGGDPLEVLDAMGGWGLQRLGTTAHTGIDYLDADLRRPTALVLGNEAHGLPTAVEAMLDAAVTIPMPGHAESLNVGMAAAIVCFEAVRQRRTPTR
jgi:RNA methyltransferase, TrmH family